MSVGKGSKKIAAFSLATLFFATLASGYSAYILYGEGGGFAFNAAANKGTVGADSYNIVSFAPGTGMPTPDYIPETQYLLTGTAVDTKAVYAKTPAATDYIFVGYYADTDCTDPFDFSQVITADTAIYLGFTQNDSVSDDSFFSIYFGYEGNPGSDYIQEAATRIANSSTKVFHISPVNANANIGDGNIAGTKNFFADPTFNKTVNPYVDATTYPYTSDNQLYDPANRIKFVLERDVIVTGVLTLGGVTGAMRNLGLSGNITGTYYELDLNGHDVDIKSGGNIRSYGIINDSVGTGTITVETNGTLATNLVIADYKQTIAFDSLWTNGVHGSAPDGNGLLPSRVWALPYLKPKTVFMINSAFYVNLRMGAWESWVHPSYDPNSGGYALREMSRQVFGVYNGWIQFWAKGYQKNDYDHPESYITRTQTAIPQTLADIESGSFRASYGLTNVQTDSTAGDSYMQLDVGGSPYVTIKPSVGELVIPPTVSIAATNSIANIASKFIMLAGAEVKLDANSTLAFGPKGKLLVARKPVRTTDTAITLPESYGNFDFSSFDDASLVIGGSVSFGGSSSAKNTLSGYVSLSATAMATVKAAVANNTLALSASAYEPELLKSPVWATRPVFYYQTPLISNGIAYSESTIASVSTASFSKKSGLFYYTDASTGNQRYFGYFLGNAINGSGLNTGSTAYTANTAQQFAEVSWDSATHLVYLNSNSYIYTGGTFLKGTLGSNGAFTADARIFGRAADTVFGYDTASGTWLEQ